MRREAEDESDAVQTIIEKRRGDMMSVGNGKEEEEQGKKNRRRGAVQEDEDGKKKQKVSKVSGVEGTELGNN